MIDSLLCIFFILCGIDSLSLQFDSAEYLDLGFNQLSGTIPSEIGLLTSLKGLLLFNNQLSGTIPVELGGLSQLGKKLDV